MNSELCNVTQKFTVIDEVASLVEEITETLVLR